MHSDVFDLLICTITTQSFLVPLYALLQITTLESELMQLMKQNGIQVNNNNNSAESRAQLSERLAALQLPSRAEAGAGEGCLSLVTHGAILALTLAMSQDDG